MSKDLNAGLRATTAATSPLVRQPNAALQQAYVTLRADHPGFRDFTTAVTQPLNVGETDYDSVLVSLQKRFSSNYEARVSYTWSKSRGNTSANGVAASGFQVLDDLHLELNEGPTNFDLRHNFVVSGRAVVPKTGGLNLSWVARALSGTPFTLTNSLVDPDRNGSLTDPLPAGNYSGNGADAYTVKDYQSRRNGAYGPSFFQLDARASYAIRFGPARRLEVLVDAFNITNRANFLNPTANQSSAQFLLFTNYSTSYTPRKLQVGARFQF
jgi:hypothetical protein